MTKKRKILLAVGVPVLLLGILAAALLWPLRGTKHVEVWGAKQAFDIANIQTIEKTPGQDFRILQLSDTQLWTLPSDNRATLQLIKDLVAQEQPDLIVLVGDTVSGLLTNMLLKQVIRTMKEINIPWAAVFGNHDDEGKAGLNWQGDRFLEAENCLFQKGPSNLYGLGNYVVNVTENGQAIQSLFFLDNGRYYDYGTDGKREVYMGYEQLAWYRWNAQGIAAATGAPVPSMAFMHFAQPEMRTAIESLAMVAEDGRYYVPEEYGFGSCAYLPGVAPVNSGFFDLCKELGTHALFFGHDHENDASIVYDGIRMTYGLKTGPSPAPWNDAKQYGGTRITIADKSNAVTVEQIVMADAGK